jgi:hypothetical protein
MATKPDELDETFLRLVDSEGVFDAIQGAANLIGHFLDANDSESRNRIINVLWHCSEKIATDIGLTSSLLSILDINALASIGHVAETSERYAKYSYALYHFGQDKEEKFILASDAYSVIAVIFKNRLKPFDGNDATVVEMATQLYAAMHNTREED